MGDYIPLTLGDELGNAKQFINIVSTSNSFARLVRIKVVRTGAAGAARDAPL